MDFLLKNPLAQPNAETGSIAIAGANTMAAYAEQFGYIGTEKAYGEGGYEITISSTTLAAEKVIMDGVRKLLQ